MCSTMIFSQITRQFTKRLTLSNLICPKLIPIQTLKMQLINKSVYNFCTIQTTCIFLKDNTHKSFILGDNKKKTRQSLSSSFSSDSYSKKNEINKEKKASSLAPYLRIQQGKLLKNKIPLHLSAIRNYVTSPFDGVFDFEDSRKRAVVPPSNANNRTLDNPLCSNNRLTYRYDEDNFRRKPTKYLEPLKLNRLSKNHFDLKMFNCLKPCQYPFLQSNEKVNEKLLEFNRKYDDGKEVTDDRICGLYDLAQNRESSGLVMELDVNGIRRTIESADFYGLLDDHMYLNDTIEIFFQRIINRNKKADFFPKVDFVTMEYISSFFELFKYETKQSKKSLRDLKDAITQKKVVLSTNWLLEMCSTKKPLESDILFFPLLKNRFFTLCVVDFQLKRLLYFNPLSVRDTPMKQYVDFIRSAINGLHYMETENEFNWKDWCFVNVGHLMPYGQYDEDCGPAVCTFAECYSRRAPVLIRSGGEDESKFLRMRIMLANCEHDGVGLTYCV